MEGEIHLYFFNSNKKWELVDGWSFFNSQKFYCLFLYPGDYEWGKYKVVYSPKSYTYVGEISVMRTNF